jgi:hypothetical protein
LKIINNLSVAFPHFSPSRASAAAPQFLLPSEGKLNT